MSVNARSGLRRLPCGAGGVLVASAAERGRPLLRRRRTRQPCPAAAGAVLYDDQGNEVSALKKRLGVTTNNVAEYAALLLGLEAALELGTERVSVRMDSELVVNQVKGGNKVRKRNRPATDVVIL